MTTEPTYKNITATVRPPRCAILIKEGEYWKAAVEGAIAQASRVWGGRQFLIIPTDGMKIAPKFWELLEAYSPDHLAIYNLSVYDLKRAAPELYRQTEERYRADWQKRGNPPEDFDNLFTEGTKTSRHDPLELSDQLSQELLTRLSPFHLNHAVDQYVSSSSGFGYPFTKIKDIVPFATGDVAKLVTPGLESDLAMSVLVGSQTGHAGGEYIQELRDSGVQCNDLPEPFSPFDLFERLLGGSARKIDGSGTLVSPDNLVPGMPFNLSMLHLGQYYRADVHHSHDEPIVVVLGDTAEDFCFYYSLSRLHEGVIWLPLAWLRDCNKALNKRRKLREQGQPMPDLTSEQETAQRLTNLALELIRYGHGENRISLCSMSLSKLALVAYRRQMARISAVGGSLVSHTDCVVIEDVSTNCVLRVFEQDNYVNHRSMVFIGGKSVSPFETPRPKNFSKIALPNHYWVTSLQIEGYQPPSLPDLGPKIANLHNSTTESRVANDGIAYHSPNSMIFSNDIDAVIVRPKIEIPTVMELFAEYFNPAGIKVGYSDKGNYFLDALHRFGGLEETGAFIKAAATRNILDKFMSKKVAEGGDIIYLDNDKRAYLNLGTISRSVGGEVAAARLVDELVGKRILQRGYIFQCELCRLVSWYGIDSLSVEFTCNRCSTRQQFTQAHWRQPAVPHWYYRLAETVYQFYLHNSHLTVQVLYKLKQQSKMAFHYAPEIDLINFSGPGKNREMDVAAILDGGIVFGECKTETLKVSDLEKFEALNRKGLKKPARVIFGTTQPVTQEFRAELVKLPNAEIFTRDDLYDQ
ncbi:hypothetical protein AB0D86_02855 [Streptomyces sp. NPDC048324]|uniref:hypothetical protein n=1 Tax=Streptomyces sp. NPDC048324 TaxID=3157205 RepID=UPI0034427B87